MLELPEVVQAMLDPQIYSHAPQKVELVQTQMSFVFLSSEYVYKVKKPVNLGYLDYTTLEQRKFFCEQEVKLNRRLCPHAYMGVVPIVQRQGRIQLGGEGEVVEYAVKMRRLPADRMMDLLLSQDQVSEEMIRKVARKLVDFHQGAEGGAEIDNCGSLNVIRFNAEENFTQTEKYIGVSITPQQYDAIKLYTENFILQNADLFDRRVREGRIKDCHGDLHAAHICFTDDICVYDCIEFNSRFRYADVAAEVSFLSMGLDYHRHPQLSRCFVDAYIEMSHDVEISCLLNFYKCYYAYVRGKVESFKLDDPYIPVEEKARVVEAARRYFELSHTYITSPLLLLTAGLVGTGKTTIAQELAQRQGWEIISSDVVRKTLAQVHPGEHHFEPFGEGIYSEEFTHRTYEEMFTRARQSLLQGHSVVLDASFKRAAERVRAQAIAHDVGADCVIIECVLDEHIMKQRLEKRLREGSVSDGRWEIFEEQKGDFEPIIEFPQANHLVVNTSKSPSEVAEYIVATFRK